MVKNTNSDLRDIAYINIQHEKLQDIVTYNPLIFKKIIAKIPLMNLVADLNWAFLSGRKRVVTIDDEESLYWINMGTMKTGKRTGDLYAFMFVEGHFLIITQSRPAGSYKIVGKPQQGVKK